MTPQSPVSEARYPMGDGAIQGISLGAFLVALSLLVFGIFEEGDNIIVWGLSALMLPLGAGFAAMPEVFFTTPHFDGHTAVLARLEPLPVDVLEHLVQAEWRRSAPKRVVAAHDGG